MNQNQYYSAIMDLMAGLCPADADELRLKTYAPLDGSYLCGICAYRIATRWDTIGMTPTFAEDVHGLLMRLRDHVLGDGEEKWLVADMRLDTTTGAFRAHFGYEKPEDDMIDLD